MRRTAFLGWLSVLLGTGLTLSAAAQEPSTRKAEPLAAAVTLARREQTLEELVRGLNAPGRPQLEAGRALKWDRATVFAHGIPLRRLQSGLSKLFNAAWMEEASAPPPGKYTLIQGQRAQDYEAQLWRETLEQRATPLFKLAGYLKTPPEEFKRLEQSLEANHQEPEDPQLRDGNVWYLSHADSRAALELALTLSSEQLYSLLSDERYFLPWSAMTPRQRELAQILALNIGKDRQNNAEQGIAPFRKGERAEDSVEWLKQFGLVLHAEIDPATDAWIGFGYGLGGMNYAGVSPQGALPMTDLLPVRGYPYKRQRGTQPPAYPDLERTPFPPEFKLDPNKTTTWTQVVAELSRHLSLPLFSDAFTFRFVPRQRDSANLPDLSKLSLAEGLDALCSRYHYLWWYEDGMLFFRNRTWFIERQYEVPPPVLALLRRQLETSGQFDTQALDALSRLTRRQLEGLNALTALDKGGLKLSYTDPEAYERLRGDSLARGAYSYLQVYAQLNEEQKRQALSPQGLPLAQMSPAQQQALLQILFMELWSELPAPPADISFRVEQKVEAPRNPQAPAVARIDFVAERLPNRGDSAGLKVAYKSGQTEPH
ncbi:MAG TPA: hypothetical protein VFB38_09380 [Chthonomonadaceae bacterium]|nr:hypothetical protein [Chthonomonadaceae bacterium]